MEIQILLVNLDSWPVKSKPDLLMALPEGNMREAPGMVVPYAIALKYMRRSWFFSEVAGKKSTTLIKMNYLIGVFFTNFT